MNNTKKLKHKLLLCLTLCPNDLAQGIQLARLWADLEPKFNENISVLIALRFDMNPDTVIDPETLWRLKQKFDVRILRVKKEGIGWPAGCNALEVGLYEWFVENNREFKIDFEYMLICEADTVPLRPGWANEIMMEAYANRSLMLGAYFTAADGCQHINGNAVLHRDFWRKCKAIWQVPSRKGWDAFIGKVTTAIGTPSRLIWQDYRLGTPENPWKGDDFLFADKVYSNPAHPLYGESLKPAMLHGIKSMQGIDAVSNRYVKKSLTLV